MDRPKTWAELQYAKWQRRDQAIDKWGPIVMGAIITIFAIGFFVAVVLMAFGSIT